ARDGPPLAPPGRARVRLADRPQLAPAGALPQLRHPGVARRRQLAAVGRVGRSPQLPGVPLQHAHLVTTPAGGLKRSAQKPRHARRRLERRSGCILMPGWAISRPAHLPAPHPPATLSGMKPEATSLDATRHRLLEGVLLRLARRPDAGDFALRGGMLLRHWFRPLPRPAEDLDLVAPRGFGVKEADRCFRPLLAERAPDGVAFDLERVRFEGIMLETGSP